MQSINNSDCAFEPRFLIEEATNYCKVKYVFEVSSNVLSWS